MTHYDRSDADLPTRTPRPFDESYTPPKAPGVTFGCAKHDQPLAGNPFLVRDSDDDNVWVFDTSDMYCPVDHYNDCAASWVVATFEDN